MESFMALADPTRRRIVEMLGDGELSAGDIARRFEVSAPAISQHLKALKAARLVSVGKIHATGTRASRSRNARVSSNNPRCSLFTG